MHRIETCIESQGRLRWLKVLKLKSFSCASFCRRLTLYLQQKAEYFSNCNHNLCIPFIVVWVLVSSESRVPFRMLDPRLQRSLVHISFRAWVFVLFHSHQFYYWMWTSVFCSRPHLAGAAFHLLCPGMWLPVLTAIWETWNYKCTVSSVMKLYNTSLHTYYFCIYELRISGI